MTSTGKAARGDDFVNAPPTCLCQVRHVQTGVRSIDGNVPQLEINKIIAAGLQLPLPEGDPAAVELWEPDVHVPDISLFMQNVKANIVLKRYSKLPDQPLDVQQEKFLRSLPAEEKEAIAQIFCVIDSDMSESISVDELSDLLEDTYGMRPTKIGEREHKHCPPNLDF